MERDIAPELLKKVLESFDYGIKTSPEFKWVLKVMESKSADYKTAHEFSKEVGRILSEAYKLNITSETLPNGKMYFNIADRVVRPTIEKAHEIVSEYATEVQTKLNYNAGLKIKGISPEINYDKVYGIVDKLTTVERYEDIAWVLDEPIKNFCQSIVEDTIEVNVKHHHKLGLKPKIVRISSGKCCAWCDKLAGTYEYPDAPKDVYRRHQRCDCVVEYHPGDGKKQNVHSKKWMDVEKSDKIEKRKKLSDISSKKKKENLIILSEYNLNVDQGNQKNHIYGTNEFRQRIKNGIEPSYFENSLEEVKKYGNNIIGTGLLIKDNKNPNVIIEKTKNHEKLNAYVVNNLNGKKVKTDRVAIRYNKNKGWHMYPDYPKKGGKK